MSNEGTYQEVVRATCGKVSGVLCEISIAVYTFGTCIAFFIVIGDQLERRKRTHRGRPIGGRFCRPCLEVSSDNLPIDECKERKGGHRSAVSDH